jgi:neutral amino acid transport system ATP-binding protein
VTDTRPEDEPRPDEQPARTDSGSVAVAQQEQGAPLLRVRGAAVSFGGLHAVDGVAFDVDEREILALIGPNGAGKSTLFGIVSGFIRPDTGSVEFAGRDITRTSAHGRARRGLVRTFQLPRVFARMTVLDNMVLAANDQPADRLGAALVPGLGRRRAKDIEQRALELLAGFGLETKAGAYAGSLSGGQRKLLEFARSLMARPRLLLLDEPLAGVNPRLGDELLAHMQRLRAEEGLAFLFVEHDMTAVMEHADRVVCMGEGRVKAIGTPEQVRSDPAVLEAYLGSDHEEDIA